jgi:hypothetical protein
MRPRKVVLCVAARELKLSVQMFVVDTWGYRALGASDESEALRILERAEPGTIDLLVLNLPLPARDWFLETAIQLQPEMHTIALNNTPEYDGNCKVDVFLPSRASPTDLLERIRILTAKKRGPKKKMVQSVQPQREEVRYG